MQVDLTPLLVAMVSTLLPATILFAANLAWGQLRPEIVKFLGEKNAAALQGRVNELLHHAIAFGVAQVEDEIRRGGATVDVKSFVVRMALQYATSHANDLARQAGDIEGQLAEKILARYASHPAVQQLYAPAPANANDAAPGAAA